MDSGRREQPIILAPNDKNRNDEIDIKEYDRILLHNADVVSNFRKVMQQKADELIKIYKINYKIIFPTEFDKKNFKLPI